MAKLHFEIHVEMEDGETWVVVADQRDIARWEIQDFGCPWGEVTSISFSLSRFLAWSASARQGKTELKWDEFNEKCIEVGDIPSEDGDADDDSEDPGQVEPSGESTSQLPE